MIEKLSKILRYSLENNEYIVDTETELEYTRTYIEILQIRYENMFTIEWDINPEAENAKIMKLSLQPIIENAIMHGIIPRRDEKGKIAIRIRKSDADLIVDIEDNGVGIPESKIAELRKLINDGTVKSKHGVGISNVNQRIKLIYGDEYGIELYSDSKKTVVSMRMKS